MTLSKALHEATALKIMGELYNIEGLYEEEFSAKSTNPCILTMRVRDNRDATFSYSELSSLLSYNDLEVYKLTKIDLKGI